MGKSNPHFESNNGLPDVIEGYLNEFTPNGLFEASNGNKYVITSSEGIDENSSLILIKYAIALVHRHLRPFTVQILGEQALEHGYWYGSFLIRLASALPEECALGFSGVISLGDKHASIQCQDLRQNYQMVSLGRVGPKGFEFRDFDGWAIEPTTRVGGPFFEKPPNGNLNLVLRPNFVRNQFGAGICNSLKQMLKEGIMEKALARPDSTKYSYRLLSPSGRLTG